MENEIFFQVREKSRNFVDGQGNLERTWKVSEKSENLKINVFGRQTSEKLFIIFKGAGGRRWSKPISLLIEGYP